MYRRVGAPKGGRVHWILWNLPSDFKRAYILRFDYPLHRYIFYRLSGTRLYDFFVVDRTSKRYFRAVYVNVVRNDVEFFGHKKPSRIAEKMYDLYLTDKNLHGRE